MISIFSLIIFTQKINRRLFLKQIYILIIILMNESKIQNDKINRQTVWLIFFSAENLRIKLKNTFYFIKNQVFFIPILFSFITFSLFVSILLFSLNHRWYYDLSKELVFFFYYTMS